MSTHRYVVMTERDTSDWTISDGPIIHETYGYQMGLSEATRRAAAMGDKYGRRQIFRLVPVCQHCGEEISGGDHACF